MADVLIETNTAVEINSSHNVLSKEDAAYLKQRGVKFIISSDAHSPNKVGCFSDAMDFADKTGIQKEDILNAI